MESVLSCSRSSSSPHAYGTTHAHTPFSFDQKREYDTNRSNEWKSIQLIPNGKSFEDFYFVGNTLSICAQNANSNRPVLKECLDVPTLRQRIVKIINKSKIPASAGGEALWRRLCEKLLNMEPNDNVMRIHEVLESQHCYYIVMEHLTGGELFDFLLNERAVPEEVCKYITRQIMRAVGHLHARDLLHRDVKPENLMFRYAKYSAPTTASQHELALIDFDTCKMLDVDPTEYKEVVNGKRRLVGTYGYLAPEVLKGGEYSRASDMWSVGVILYILMTGIPPLPMDLMNSAKESVEVHRAAEVEGIDFNLSPLPEFPKSRDLCKRLLEWDPRKRLNSAAEALKHPWLAERSSKSRVPSPLPPLSSAPSPAACGSPSAPTPNLDGASIYAQPRFANAAACADADSTPSTIAVSLSSSPIITPLSLSSSGSSLPSPHHPISYASAGCGGGPSPLSAHATYPNLSMAAYSPSSSTNSPYGARAHLAHAHAHAHAAAMASGAHASNMTTLPGGRPPLSLTVPVRQGHPYNDYSWNWMSPSPVVCNKVVDKGQARYPHARTDSLDTRSPITPMPAQDAKPSVP